MTLKNPWKTFLTVFPFWKRLRTNPNFWRFCRKPERIALITAAGKISRPDRKEIKKRKKDKKAAKTPGDCGKRAKAQGRHRHSKGQGSRGLFSSPADFVTRSGNWKLEESHKNTGNATQLLCVQGRVYTSFIIFMTPCARNVRNSIIRNASRPLP